MTEAFGTALTEAAQRLSRLDGVAYARSLVETNGPASGSRLIRLANASGLELELHPDRALDIGRVTVDGIPVNWLSASGIGSPDAFEPQGKGWLRTFGGGLLATCGLEAFGPPSLDEGIEYGQHGRIGVQRAEVVRLEANEEGVVVEAVVRQSALFGENFTLRRRVSADIGSRSFVVTDTVTNDSPADVAHMVLYHVNVGWPLLDDDTQVSIPSGSVTPRDEDAEPGLAEHEKVGRPIAGYREQVFLHEMFAQRKVAVTNVRRGLRLQMDFSDTLPFLFQWKLTGVGEYVLGIEPSNTRNVYGRAAARAAGELPMLGAGKSITYELRFSFESAGQ